LEQLPVPSPRLRAIRGGQLLDAHEHYYCMKSPPNGLELSCPAAQASFHPFSRILAGKPTRPFRQPAGSASASCYAPRAPRHLAPQPAPLPLMTLPPCRQPARRPLPRPLTHPRLPRSNRRPCHCRRPWRAVLTSQATPSTSSRVCPAKPHSDMHFPSRGIPAWREDAHGRRPLGLRPRTCGRLGGLTITHREALAGMPCLQA
jgi:hypothetical protein